MVYNYKNLKFEDVPRGMKEIEGEISGYIMNSVKEIIVGLIMSVIGFFIEPIYKLIIKLADLDISFSDYSHKIIVTNQIISFALFMSDFV